MGVLSALELDPDLRRLAPLTTPVEALRGADDPKPTGVRSCDVREPLRMLDERRTELPPRGLSSLLRDMFDPVLRGRGVRVGSVCRAKTMRRI